MHSVRYNFSCPVGLPRVARVQGGMAMTSDGSVAGSASPAARLLLGVHAWPTADSLRRRRVIRRLSPSTEYVKLRFIMHDATLVPKRGVPAESEAEAHDIIKFSFNTEYVPAKVLHNFMLATAFLRYALTTSYEFVGRTEDDALMDLHSLGLMLQPFARIPLLAFSPRGQWVMWDHETMLSHCWNTGPNCKGTGDCRLSFSGPFLLLQGPLVIYSRELARTLLALPQLAHDEARIQTNWSGVVRARRAAEQADRPGAPPRLGIVHSGVAEDVYFSALLGASAPFTSRNVTLASVPLSEYDWRVPRPTHQLRSAAVYHRLTNSYLLNVSGLVTSSAPSQRRSTGARHKAVDGDAPSDLSATALLGEWWQRAHKPALSTCKPMADRFRRVFRLKNDKPMAGRFCCPDWVFCDP
jgi:hypothetical protein